MNKSKYCKLILCMVFFVLKFCTMILITKLDLLNCCAVVLHALNCNFHFKQMFSVTRKLCVKISLFKCVDVYFLKMCALSTLCKI